MYCPAVLVGARLADAGIVHPFRCRAAAAVMAHAKTREPRLARTLDEDLQGVEEGCLGQAAPLQHADPSRPRREGERRLPYPGELRHDHAALRQRDDDIGWLAADELHGA